MLNNILNVQENRPWTKKVVNLLHKVLYFKMYVIIASMINRFEETIEKFRSEKILCRSIC